MLTELNHITLQADGRYVTPEEWQPVQTYLAQLRQRFSAYSKIQAAADQILQEVERRLLQRAPRIFHKGQRDMSAICRRDRADVLRYICATLLTGDITAYKQRLLCWLQTIARSFQDQVAARQTYEVLGEVLKEKLPPQEFALVRPIVEVTAEMLGS
ncbi:MAG: hypothetical protein RMI89_02450 [Gloeomargarita sp. SKYBB_i_bin120]|nr:hypothetical protein [Gloeomargarita sp. SKYG98]MCS7291821.1 hypothetical protein [Gloeomargarita sp. SKYB120]MDW8177381.1 hypothetical protein [Gloeomargarita sp. SKYBB_i_bin120]